MNSSVTIGRPSNTTQEDVIGSEFVATTNVVVVVVVVVRDKMASLHYRPGDSILPQRFAGRTNRYTQNMFD